MLPTTPERCKHDYVRNGTTSLFAAYRLASGSVIAQHYRRHRHQEFLRFFKLIDTAVPKDLDLRRGPGAGLVAGRPGRSRRGRQPGHGRPGRDDRDRLLGESPRSPACKPSPPADQPEHPYDKEGETPGPVEPRPPAQQPDSPPWPAPEITHQPNNSGQNASGAKDRG